MNASLRTDDVMRYQDARFQTIAAKLLPTQYLVVDDGTALVTVLGSCIAACVRDPLLQLGGMNHFMLPEGNVGDGAPARVSGLRRLRSLGWARDRTQPLWRVEQSAPLPFTLLSVTTELKVND